MKNSDLNIIRKKIDMIDSGIIELLNQRMELAVRARKFKQGVFDQKREQQIFNNIKKSSRNLLKPEFLEKLYGLIIDESKQVQEQNLITIGFQGEHGAFSEVASLLYDASLIPVSCKEFTEIFDEVLSGKINLGIVPVENSLEGAVTQVNDLLVQTDLRIVGEVGIPVHHCLLALPETQYHDLKVAYSHPQALAQCREFISRHRLEPRPFYDTAGAAKMLSENRPEATGVIANKLCAELYRLEIIKENIEDHESNSTRFIVLSKEAGDEPGGDKCSIVFSVKHEAGGLFTVLKAFYDKGINLTRIESRPAKGDPGKYVFFLDFEGSDKEDKVADILKEVLKSTTSFKFLGCYKSYKGAI
jgi:prephenate dehydratase/chorismate mutase/prephenate dehydratase